MSGSASVSLGAAPSSPAMAARAANAINTELPRLDSNQQPSD